MFQLLYVKCKRSTEQQFPAGIYLLNVNNKKHVQTWSKLTTTPERRNWHLSGVFIINFQHISPLVLLFLLFTLYMQLLVGLVTKSAEQQRFTSAEQ